MLKKRQEAIFRDEIKKRNERLFSTASMKILLTKIFREQRLFLKQRAQLNTHVRKNMTQVGEVAQQVKVLVV